MEIETRHPLAVEFIFFSQHFPRVPLLPPQSLKSRIFRKSELAT